MAVDVLFEVWHATVTNLDCVSVKELIITRNLGHFEPASKVSGVSYSQEN